MKRSVHEPAYASEMYEIDPDLVQNINFFKVLLLLYEL